MATDRHRLGHDFGVVDSPRLLSLREEAMLRASALSHDADESDADNKGGWFASKADHGNGVGFESAVVGRQNQHRYQHQQQHQPQHANFHSLLSSSASDVGGSSYATSAACRQDELLQLQREHPLAMPPPPATSSSSISSGTTCSSSGFFRDHHRPSDDDRDRSNAAMDPASAARQDWRNHGGGLTQLLEERRLQHQDLAGSLTVRVFAAQPRVDLAGSGYTAYVIRVSQRPPHGEQYGGGRTLESLVERRYSEFAKLHQVLRANNVTLDAGFPSKHWAGRVGNWTPSARWAPERHEELVQYRIVQLDVWLVHVVDKYNHCIRPQRPPLQGQHATSFGLCDHFLPAPVLHEVHDFLLGDTAKPPCDKVNDLEACSPGERSWRWNNPFSFTLGSSIRQATCTIQYMCSLGNGNGNGNGNYAAGASRQHTAQQLQAADQSIPLDLLHAAQGLCFMTVFKAGVVVSGRVGTGLVVRRLSKQEQRLQDRGTQGGGDGTPACHNYGWSAPCAVGTVGVGWGALMGGDVTHYLIVLTTQKAVQDLVGGASSVLQSSVQLGAELDVAVGPVGRGATSHLAAGDWTLHPAYAYAHSQGFFVGMSLEGSVVAVRNDVNSKFYGTPSITEPALLLRRPGPKAAEPLYQALHQAMLRPIPNNSFRPSQLFSPTSYEEDDVDDDYVVVRRGRRREAAAGTGSGASSQPVPATRTDNLAAPATPGTRILTRTTSAAVAAAAAGGHALERSGGVLRHQRQHQQQPQQEAGRYSYYNGL